MNELMDGTPCNICQRKIAIRGYQKGWFFRDFIAGKRMRAQDYCAQSTNYRDGKCFEIGYYRLLRETNDI